MRSRTLRLVIIALSCVCLTSFSRAEEDADTRKLLDTLKSDDFDAREASKKKLIEKGEAIRELITAEQAKKDLDPDYATYLKTIIGKLKDADVLKAFDTPKRIDLDIHDEAVSAVLAKIKTHFGFSTSAQKDASDKKIDLKIKGATFMESIEAVRKAGKLAYDRNALMQGMFRGRLGNGEDSVSGIVLKDTANADDVPSAAKGPALVFFETINFNMSRTLSFGNGVQRNANAQKNYYIQGYVIVEPELRCSAIGLVNFRSAGANNETITASNVSLHNYWGGQEAKGGFVVYNFNANFTPQADPPEKLSWKMAVKIQVPVKIGEKRFDNLPDIVGKTEDFFGGSFTLQKFERNTANGWKLSYKATGSLMEIVSGTRRSRVRDGSESLSGGNPEFAAGMVVLGAQGKPLDSNSSRGSGSNTSYVYDLEFSEEPRSIVFKKPGSTETREFELEIANVPLP
ncbi:MAG: hypothetical protein WCT04_13995 [Planctomycetota bacterium]